MTNALREICKIKTFGSLHKKVKDLYVCHIATVLELGKKLKDLKV